MLQLMILVALAAEPGSTRSNDVKLAATGFSTVNLSEALADFFSDHFAQQLTLQGFRVLTKNEITAVIGFERQKEMLGCKDSSSSCMAELANALGVDGLIIGSLAKFDNSYQVNLKVVAALDAKPLSVFSAQAEGDKGLVQRLNEAALLMAPAVRKELGRPEVSAPPALAAARAPPQVSDVTGTASAGSNRKWLLVPAVIGGTFLIGGGAMVGVAVSEAGKIPDPAATPGLLEARSRAATADQLRIAGLVGVGVGAAALATAATMFILGGSPDDTVSLLPALTSSSGGAVVRARF